jgi:ADP-ribose pyrophosphatase YjhB (NUDIX family)
MKVGITKPVKVNANALVTNSKGEILLTRLKVGHFAGSLCIPGGGVQLGELSHEAARREVFEETGIKVQGEFTHYGFCELMKAEINQHKIVMLLHAKAEGIPVDTEEGTGGWYTYETAEKDRCSPLHRSESNAPRARTLQPTHSSCQNTSTRRALPFTSIILKRFA